MEEIVELKNNLENFNRIGAIDSSSYAIIMNNLNGLETKLGSDGGPGSEGNSSSSNQESFEALLDEKLLLEHEKEALTDKVEKLSRDLRRLENELESMEKVVLEHKEVSGKLLNEKLLLGQEKEALGSQVSTLSRGLKALESELESMGKAASERKESFEGLVAEKLLLNQEKEFLESRVSSLSGELDLLRNELESTEKVALDHKESSLRLLKEKLFLEQEKLLLEQEKVSLIAQAAKLTKENSEFRSKLVKLQRSRPSLTPLNLVSTFKTSLEEVNRELKKTPSGAGYSVGNMNVSLKTNLAFEGEELRFQMPKADDVIPLENLSTIEFSLGMVPEKLVSSSTSSASSSTSSASSSTSSASPSTTSSYREVPDLVGLSKREAESILLKAGFKPGEVLEKNSSIPQDMVISQLPASGGLAEQGSAVDLIIAKILPLKVPDLLGLELEIAKTVIGMSGLKLGGVRKKLSEGKSGLVLSQSFKPGSEVELNSKIILMVSVNPEIGVSETILDERLDANPKDAATEDFIETLSDVSTVTSKVSTETQVAPSKDAATEVSIETSSEVSTASSKCSTECQVAPSSSKPDLKMKPPIIQRPGFLKSSHVDTKTVPSVIELTLEIASEILKAEGVKIGKISEIVSMVSPGTVLYQSPKAGCIANPLIPVDLVVSREKPKLKPPIIQRGASLKSHIGDVRKVPRVVDMPYEKAASLLENEGIKIGNISEIVSGISPGTVLHQSPKAGCIANPLIPINLVVSKEKPTLKPPIIQRPGALMSPKKDVKKVPCVTGVSFEEAVGLLKEEGIKVGKISEVISRISPGTVLYQGPKAGCVANSLVPVDLVVSRERPKLKPPIIQRPGFLIFRERDSKNVPPVLGMPFEKAVEILKQEGIKVGKISEILSGESSGRVLHQSPRAGSIANPIIPIDLVVSKERPKLKPPIIQRPGALNCSKTDVKKIPGVTGVSLEEAVGILKQEGTKVGKVSVVVSRISPGTVLNQSPKAGCIANSLIPVDLMVSREAVHEVKTVPRVTGLPFEEAVDVLESEGVNIGKISRIFSRASPDIVLFQGPKSGSIANSLIPIDLVVSREIIPEVKKVPGVVDMPLAEAIETLEMEGVNVGKITEVSTPMSSGTVLFQSPRSGCIANPIIPVDLVISREIVPEVKTVPRVTNMAFEKAVETLKQEGIKIGRISRIFSRASPDMVLFQSPKSGSIANPIIPVDLVVSREILPEVKKVSRVVDMPFEKAVGVLKKEGVNVGKITEISSRFSPGIVLVQSPKSGSIANPIIPVDLVVSKAPEIEVKKVPRVLGLPVEEAIDVLEREGVNVGRVSRIFSRSSPDIVLFQGPRSGSIANPIIPVDLVVSKEYVPEVKKVPRVIDMPFEKAIETLKMEGVGVGKVSCISSKVRPDVVLFQSPKSGCIANPVIPVDLVVSRARKIEVKTVPRVIGLSLDKAIAVLEQEDVKIGKLSVISSRFSPGTVLHQGPRAGCIANPVIPVDLFVSKQPPEPESPPVRKPEVQAELSETSKAEVKEVPMVVNMHLDEAREVLKREGFNVGNILETSSRYSPGTVLSQNPKNGCFAGPELPVDMVVSKKKSRLTLRRLARLRR